MLELRHTFDWQLIEQKTQLKYELESITETLKSTQDNGQLYSLCRDYVRVFEQLAITEKQLKEISQSQIDKKTIGEIKNEL